MWISYYLFSVQNPTNSFTGGDAHHSSYERLIPSMDMEIGQYCLFGGGHRQHHPTKYRTNVLCCPGPIVIRICNLFISCRASILVSWWIKNFINVVVRIIFMFFLDKNRRTKKERSIFSPITTK